MLLSSEILVGTDTRGAVFFGHTLQIRQKESSVRRRPADGAEKAFVSRPDRLRGPDFVLEAGEEACGDAETWVQEVFFIRRLQTLWVCIKFLWNIEGPISDR